MLDRKDMYYNFDMIIPRLSDALEHLNMNQVNDVLSSINMNCICIGTGGSNSVSAFASIILEHTNKIIAISREPRDVLYMNLNNYNHVLGITYGNRNYGIDEAKRVARDLRHTLITTNSDNINDICYKGVIPREHSFISLASTILPMSILLGYFLDANKKVLLDLISKMYLGASTSEYDFDFEGNFPIFEIMSGDNTYVASKVLESTITEAGLGIPIVHEKYAYCHGRSSLSYTAGNSNLIYLINSESNIDGKLLMELEALYKNIIILRSKANDTIVGEFDLVLQVLFLCKLIAESQSKDLSQVNHSEITRKVYRYNGGM